MLQLNKLPEVLSLPNFRALLCSIITLTKRKKFLLQAQELASENEEQAWKKKRGGLLGSHLTNTEYLHVVV